MTLHVRQYIIAFINELFEAQNLFLQPEKVSLLDPHFRYIV